MISVVCNRFIMQKSVLANLGLGKCLVWWLTGGSGARKVMCCLRKVVATGSLYGCHRTLHATAKFLTGTVRAYFDSQRYQAREIQLCTLSHQARKDLAKCSMRRQVPAVSNAPLEKLVSRIQLLVGKLQKNSQNQKDIEANLMKIL